ncbi:MAG TPA: aminotransferase class V-fold PLP-dependent enzyme, partial [Chthoniobacterales bacterium]
MRDAKYAMMRVETLAVHAGHEVDSATGAVAAPIHLSTTFERDAEGNYPHGYIYGRSANPNRNALEQALAALEGGEEAAAFASGLAASSAVLQSLASGDHVVAPRDVYHGMTKLLREIYIRWGLEVTFVDMTNVADVKNAIRPTTKLLWIETPSNPLLKITDIAAVAEIAHAAGALCACDNTWAPIVQRPLDLGCDLVMHSTTKYLGGHSDVTGGAIIAKTP